MSISINWVRISNKRRSFAKNDQKFKMGTDVNVLVSDAQLRPSDY